MSIVTQWFQPPLYWQQFEDLTVEVFRVVYNDPHPTKFGRPGQAQQGVDVYGSQNGAGPLIGIQCKRMDERDENNLPQPGGTITPKFFRQEMKAAKGFKPKLDTWVLATTAKRDAKIQRFAAELNDRSRSSGGFGIHVWFWDDFVTDLNRNYDLQQRYYRDVIQVESPDDQDKIILEMLGEAFSRAAFRTPLHQEAPAEFVQALKDTQHAINTGELKDRETRRVIRKAIGGRRAIASEKVRGLLCVADKALQRLRDRFQEELNHGVIQQSGTCLQIPALLQSDLSKMRDESVAAVNAALRCAGLDPI